MFSEGKAGKPKVQTEDKVIATQETTAIQEIFGASVSEVVSMILAASIKPDKVNKDKLQMLLKNLIIYNQGQCLAFIFKTLESNSSVLEHLSHFNSKLLREGCVTSSALDEEIRSIQESPEKGRKPLHFLRTELNSESYSDILHMAFSRDAVDSITILHQQGILDFDFDYANQLLLLAIDSHAVRIATYLLEHINLTDKNKKQLIEKACKQGNLSLINLLNDNPQFYLLRLMESKPTSTEIFLSISLLYRFNPMSLVDEICTTFIRDNSQHIDIIRQIKNARDSFLNQWGPELPRYSGQNANELVTAYNATIAIQQEMEFGLRYSALIKKMLGQNNLPDNKLPEEITKNFPLPEGYKDNNKSFYSMRTIAAMVANESFNIAVERKNGKAELFKRVRINVPCTTDYSHSRYDHALPYIARMSTLKDDAKRDDIQFHKELRLHDHIKDVYTLSCDAKEESKTVRKTISIATVPKNKSQEEHRWIHGLVPIHEVWEQIEKLHAEIFKMTIDEVKENPGAFYSKIARTLSLLGKTTPFVRGTGSIVQVWLALVHQYFGLTPPILKLGTQLDCLNLTFPSSIYEKILLDLFEPNSLPAFAVKYNLDMHQNDPETRRLALHFQLSALPQSADLALFSDFMTQGPQALFQPAIADSPPAVAPATRKKSLTPPGSENS